MFHKNVIPDDNHTIISWIVADSAALAALTPVATDVGKVAHQLSSNEFFILQDDSPVEWKSLTGATANQIPVVDSGGFFVGTNVEDILAEIGQELADINAAITADRQTIAVACSDESTNITAGNNKVVFHMPYNFEIAEIFAGLSVAQASGAAFIVDVNKNGSSILSTKLTFDNTESTTLTAGVPPVLTTTALAKGDKISVDIDQVGAVGSKGLKVYIVGKKT